MKLYASLKPHPDTLAEGVRSVDVELHVLEDRIRTEFRVSGGSCLAVPAKASPARRDRLWRTTCFELFLKPCGGEAYYEYNFSPSTEWASYRFDRYREGMTPLFQAVEPCVARNLDDSSALVIRADLPGVPHVPARLGLCAVIEERDSRKSYWALAHPPGAPDFHHDHCFAFQLPAAGSS